MALQVPRRSFSRSDVSSPTSIVTDSMLALVDAFFSTLYPLPSYAFIHPGTVKRQCRDGQVNRALASGVCAITSLHLGHHHSAATKWIQDTEQNIWMHLEHPNVPRLQALLLVIYYRMETGNLQRAFMLTANAARFAAAMRLNHEKPELDPIVQETRRRIVWSLKIVERYFSVGLPEFELCPTEAIYLSYPAPEEDYSGDAGGERGAHGLHIRLEVARRDIMKLTRSLAIVDQPLTSLEDLVRYHKGALANIGALMPEFLPDIPAQITELIASPWLSRHLSVRISWHQAHCDLYRIMIPGYPEAAPPVIVDAIDAETKAAAEQQCLKHASAAIRLLTLLNQESQSRHFLEFDVAICAYHAARLLLFISRFGTTPCRPSAEFAASRAELCLVALRRFFPSSLLVAPMIEELQYSVGVFTEQQQQQLIRPPAPASKSLYSAGVGAPSDDERQTNPGPGETQRLAVHSLLRQAEFLDGEQQSPPSDLASTEELSQRLPTRSESLGIADVRGVGAAAQRADDGSVNGAARPSPPTQQTPGFVVGDWHVDQLGDGGQPFFSWCGPEDWDWLFEGEAPV